MYEKMLRKNHKHHLLYSHKAVGKICKVCLDARTPDIAEGKQDAISNVFCINNTVSLVLFCDSLSDSALDPVCANHNVGLECCTVLEMYDRSRTILPRNQSTSFVEMDSAGIEKLHKSVKEGCSKHLRSAEIPFLYKDILQTCVFPASCLLVEVGTRWDLSNQQRTKRIPEAGILHYGCADGISSQKRR